MLLKLVAASPASPRSSATAASPRNPSSPACSAARATLRSSPRSSATSTRSGTPATSRTSASSASTPQACVQLVVYVREKPTIREINYKGLNAVSLSDVQERFKKAKVGLTVESQYDPTRIKRAEVVLKDLLSEHGHQFATIKTEVKTIPPAAGRASPSISRKARRSRSARSPSTATNNLSDRTCATRW
jgi:hypothetical protein